ncbi:MAG: pyruvate ferredoxin oxidoreductase [Eubacterium sp.]|nr:pyruvate ferredoxin oxidoreductase [Eubacterium sp.]
MAGKRDRMSGNEAVALAIKQVNPDVMPAFPITPSTEIPQMVSTFIANGEIDTEFIPVESEHSSMSAAIGASAAGARALTATSSCGLAFMWEELYIAASDRLPLVLCLVNRALTGPININCDHSDSMGARDSGWMQVYAETNQEAYDNFIMAYLVTEHPDVKLPMMVCQDGFITSHAVMNIETLDTEVVREFVGDYKPENFLLNAEMPMAIGPYANSPFYMETKMNQRIAMKNAKKVILDVCEKFEKISGRKYGLFEEYMLEDAEYAIVIIGSAAGNTKDAVDLLREKGEKVGLLKLRVFRPFPGEEIAEALKNTKAVAVLDRAESFSGMGGPVGTETKAALMDAGVTSKVLNYFYGIGGRDYTEEEAIAVYEDLKRFAAGEEVEQYQYIGLRSREEK